jgi:hypothetical protein
MKKHFLIALLAILCLSLTSCIDFLEEITINKDGSGSYFMEINMEKAMEKLAAMMPQDKQAEMKEKGFLKEEDIREIDSLSQVLQEKIGVQNFQFKNEDLALHFSFDFDNIHQAYEAMETMFNQEEGAPGPGLGTIGNSVMHLEQKGRKYLFNRFTPAKVDSDDRGEEDTMENMEAMMGPMLEGGTYESIIHFPAKVKVSGNKQASLSKDKKTVIIRTDLKELFDNQNVADFKASYKVK